MPKPQGKKKPKSNQSLRARPDLPLLALRIWSWEPATAPGPCKFQNSSKVTKKTLLKSDSKNDFLARKGRFLSVFSDQKVTFGVTFASLGGSAPKVTFSHFWAILNYFFGVREPVAGSHFQQLTEGKKRANRQGKNSPNFAPNFSRTSHTLFLGERRPQKINQTSLPFFNAKSPRKVKERIHKSFLESGQAKNLKKYLGWNFRSRLKRPIPLEEFNFDLQKSPQKRAWWLTWYVHSRLQISEPQTE